MQDLTKILQEDYLEIFNCKYLAGFFIFCKKSFIFSVRLARYVQDLMQYLASLARKILARLEYFLQDRFYWVDHDALKVSQYSNMQLYMINAIVS